MGITRDQASLPSPLRGEGNLAVLLSSAAARWGQRCAVVYEDIELSYEELETRARLAAAGLAEMGVGAGDRVGLQIPNSPTFVALYYGILRLGAIVVPQNPIATPREIDQTLSDAGATLLVAWDTDPSPAQMTQSGIRRMPVDDATGGSLPSGASPLDELVPVQREDTAVILYTSGTTGRPKGAELTHANLGLNAAAAVDIYSLVGDDVVLGVLPLYHSYGQTCTLNGSIAVGARVILSAAFEATRAARLIKDHRVTVLLGVPTMFSELAHCEAGENAFGSLRICSSGGAPLPPEVREQCEARTGAPLYETYGLSETSPIASFNGRGTERRSGTVGWAIPGTEMKIVDGDRRRLSPGEIGEIAIRGHNIMKGYWGNPEATTSAIDADGWFFSGDLGTADEDGCIRVTGRLKDMIIRGGLNVYPRELEDLLHTHPSVRMVAVVGVPDARLGEEVGAAVMVEPEAEIQTGELRDWIKARVTPYKYPRHIWFVDRLPTGPTGKILKRAIALPPELSGAGDVNDPSDERG